MNNNNLPQEIIDKIFLLLDYKTLEKTREIQSEYVKKNTSIFAPIVVARKGNLERLKWLYHMGYPCDTSISEAAALNGDIDILWWVHTILFERLSCLTLKNAVIYGNLSVIKRLVNWGCLRDDSAFIAAVKKGDADIIDFLHYNWCDPIDKKYAIIEAINNDHLHVLKLLKNYWYEPLLTDGTYEIAQRQEKEEIAEWLQKNPF